MGMSFKEAFAKARKEKGPGKTFTWNGKSYSTNYAEEAEKKEDKKDSPKPTKRPRQKGATTTSPRPTRRGEPAKKRTQSVPKKTDGKYQPTGKEPDTRKKPSNKGGLSDKKSSGTGGLSDRKSSTKSKPKPTPKRTGSSGVNRNAPSKPSNRNSRGSGGKGPVKGIEWLGDLFKRGGASDR